MFTGYDFKVITNLICQLFELGFYLVKFFLGVIVGG